MPTVPTLAKKLLIGEVRDNFMPAPQAAQRSALPSQRDDASYSAQEFVLSAFPKCFHLGIAILSRLFARLSPV